jgi:hypothetical protein
LSCVKERLSPFKRNCGPKETLTVQTAGLQRQTLVPEVRRKAPNLACQRVLQILRAKEISMRPALERSREQMWPHVLLVIFFFLFLSQTSSVVPLAIASSRLQPPRRGTNLLTKLVVSSLINHHVEAALIAEMTSPAGESPVASPTYGYFASKHSTGKVSSL